jgi:hypothetical protein
MKTTYLFLIAMLISLASFTACTETIIETEQAPVVVQMLVDIQSESIVTGYAPRIVYEAEVVESNRPTPQVINLDFTEFLESGKGQLPVNIVEGNLQVEAQLERDNTYKVLSSFTSFN